MFTWSSTNWKSVFFQENFRHIDYDFNYNLAKVAKEMNVRLYCLVSANNANAESKLSYYQVKGKVSVFGIEYVLCYSFFVIITLTEKHFCIFYFLIPLISSWLLVSVNFTIQFSRGTLFCIGNIIKVMKRESSKRS